MGEKTSLRAKLKLTIYVEETITNKAEVILKTAWLKKKWEIKGESFFELLQASALSQKKKANWETPISDFKMSDQRIIVK